jgi:hypothetical protein
VEAEQLRESHRSFIFYFSERNLFTRVCVSCCALCFVCVLCVVAAAPFLGRGSDGSAPSPLLKPLKVIASFSPLLLPVERQMAFRFSRHVGGVLRALKAGRLVALREKREDYA